MASNIKFSTNGMVSAKYVKPHYLTGINLIRYGCGKGKTVESTAQWTSNYTITESTSIGRGSWNTQAHSYYGYNITNSTTNTVMCSQTLPTKLTSGHYYYFSCYHGNTAEVVNLRLSSTSTGSVSTIVGMPTTTSYTASFFSHVFQVNGSDWDKIDFVKNSSTTTTFYFSRVILFDLTALGISVTSSNASTWKTYVDNYLRENRTYVGGNGGESSTPQEFTASGWSVTSTKLAPSSTFPEYMWAVAGSSTSEAYLRSTAYLRSGDIYYYAYIYAIGSNSSTTFDWYFPEAEPSFASGIGNNNITYQKISAFGLRSGYTATSGAAVRFDVNNQSGTHTFSTWGGMWNASTMLTKYNNTLNPSSTNVNITDTGVNKYFFDCHFDGWSQPIIHLPDPNYKKVLFDTSYVLHCSDVIIHPATSNIYFDTAGRLHCKGITDDYSQNLPYPMSV